MLRVVGSPLFFALAALTLLLVAMECAWPGFFLHDDNASWFAGAYAHDFRTLTQSGEVAEVNFYQYGGEPFLEQGQTGVLYPPVYVAGALASLWPGDLRATVDWLAAIHLAIAVVGFYVWLRRGGTDAWVAALGGLVWALNPFVLLLGASWIMVTAAAAWLPWLFWAVDLIVAPARTPPGCGSCFNLFRGCRAPSEQGALDPRLQMLQASGLPTTEPDNLPADVSGSRRTPGGGPSDYCEPETTLRSSTSPSPSVRRLPTAALGVIAGLFVLQGYVQWAAYAFLFAGMYAAFQVFAAKERLRPLVALGFAGLIAAAIALPQVLPLLHGAAESKARAEELSPMFELFYSVEPGDLLAAQVGFFREHFLFGASTALFFCPALVLLPVALVAFVRGDEAARRRLFPLILLAVIALVFSGRGYFLLNVVPFMAKFRWPFKVFLFAEFFLVAGLVWACALWGSPRPTGAGRGGEGEPDNRLRKSPSPPLGQRRLPLLVLVVILQVAVALAVHERNFLSAAVLPTRQTDLPAEVDLTRGRVIAAGNVVPVKTAHLFYTLAYGTFYEVPSIGGYNPLVSRESLAFAQGMDIPNFWNLFISPEALVVFEDRGVRYWIVDPRSPQGKQLGNLSSMKYLGGGLSADFLRIRPVFRYFPNTDRAVYEDMGAKPLAYDEANPQSSLPVRYGGNSMLVQLTGTAGTVAVSVGQSDGWWYQVDGTGWKQSGYSDYRLHIPVGAGSRELEVRYFDSRLRSGLGISLIISILLGIGYFLLPGLRARLG